MYTFLIFPVRNAIVSALGVPTVKIRHGNKLVSVQAKMPRQPIFYLLP